MRDASAGESEASSHAIDADEHGEGEAEDHARGLEHRQARAVCGELDGVRHAECGGEAEDAAEDAADRALDEDLREDVPGFRADGAADADLADALGEADAADDEADAGDEATGEPRAARGVLDALGEFLACVESEILHAAVRLGEESRYFVNGILHMGSHCPAPGRSDVDEDSGSFGEISSRGAPTSRPIRTSAG